MCGNFDLFFSTTLIVVSRSDNVDSAALRCLLSSFLVSLISCVFVAVS
jgi:hypothetical protein